MSTEAPDPRDEAARRALSGARLGRFPWLAGVLVALAGQGLLLARIAGGDDAAAWVGPIVGIVLLQAVKAAWTLRRLRDVGRPPDDVLWAVTPVLSAALFLQLLLEGAPSEAVRHKRARVWASQTDVVAAYRAALRPMAATWPIGLVSVGGLALLSAVVGQRFVEDVFEASGGADGAAIVDGLGLAAAALAVVTLLQVARRSRASRASWLPSLLLLPVSLALVGVHYRSTTSQGAGAILLMLVDLAWQLGPVAIAAGLANAAWIAGARLVDAGESAALDAVIARASGTWLDVAATWAWRSQIVQIGAQIVVPGVWFGVSYAFADLVAATHPEERVLHGSAERVQGARGRVFKLLVVWFLVGTLLQGLVTVSLVGPAAAWESMLDPRALPESVAFLADAGTWFATWWTLHATWRVYGERDALLLARRARATAPAELSGA
jgi:hypothetical protein